MDTAAGLYPYALVILPDEISIEAKLADKLADFLASGDFLVASHRSGLNTAGDAFALDVIGVGLVCEAPYSVLCTARGLIGKGHPETGHVMYVKALEVAARPESDTLAVTLVPYFNRKREHYCSHRHTPSADRPEYPAVVKHGHGMLS